MKYFSVLILLLFITKGFSSPADLSPEDEVLLNVDEEVVQPSDESNINDPTIVFSDPINSATKLLYDLDVDVVQLLVPKQNSLSNNNVVDSMTTLDPTTVVSPQDPKDINTEPPTTHVPLIYSALNSELHLVLVRQNENVNALVTQMDTLQKRLQDTINELTTRRRYILSAMLRPMLTSVRRIRSNVVRIQSQLTSIQSAATQTVGSNRPAIGAADQGAIDGIRKRVEDIQKRIGDIIGRISSQLSLPGSNTAGQQRPSSGSTGR